MESERRSLGHLVTEYLLGEQSAKQYQQRLRNDRHQYNGFNLLFGNLTDLWIYNNHLNQTVKLEKGIHGLSNADIHSVWPKTGRGVERLARHCRQSHLDPEALFYLLGDENKAPDHLLPDTGVPMEDCRQSLSVGKNTAPAVPPCCWSMASTGPSGWNAPSIIRAICSMKFIWH